ncbi:FAD-binding protein [Dongia sp.]|uniref:FAD-binding protein n=1 Tax=Dongia sp. TaxID=1977262 RepID=UPI0035B0D55C
MDHLTPRSETELADIVAESYAKDTPLTLLGRGTKAGWGRAASPAIPVALSALTGISDYTPAELVLTVGAGTPLAEIRAALAAEHQHLAFEPVDLGPLFGHARDQATIGGVLACNLSGSRRPFAGAARDYFLGFRGVNGRGEIFKAGGKVVKNVTGYDLPKLMAGSFGTLAALTEVTLKVLPAPETSLSLIFPDLDIVAANQAMIAALGSTADPSGAAFLPSAAVAAIGFLATQLGGRSAMILRLEGSAASVGYRRHVLSEILGSEVTVVDNVASIELWQAINALAPFAGDRDRAIWLISVPPAAAADVVRRLELVLSAIQYFVDWGGGRIWLSLPTMPENKDAHAGAIRSALKEGGHASLIRAPAACRAGDHVFSAEVPIDLLRRVRIAFDPKRVLNRGRLHSEL